MRHEEAQLWARGFHYLSLIAEKIEEYSRLNVELRQSTYELVQQTASLNRQTASLHQSVSEIKGLGARVAQLGEDIKKYIK